MTKPYGFCAEEEGGRTYGFSNKEGFTAFGPLVYDSFLPVVYGKFVTCNHFIVRSFSEGSEVKVITPQEYL